MTAMRRILATFAFSAAALAGPYAPAAGQPGSTAIPYDFPGIVAWATSVHELLRGPSDISDPLSPLVNWGIGADALGIADAQDDSFPVVSLGDGGRITLKFTQPIGNGPGADFAVFENAIHDSFLELAFVEVSSDGLRYSRFPAISLTPADSQTGSFGLLDTTDIHNLAGKYRRGYGTPFDLGALLPSPFVNINAITHVRILDVVGSIDPAFATFDSLGNIVNDPWPTNFETGGFDLDAVAVLNIGVPEPGAAALLLAGGMAAIRRRRTRP
jgi:hypothetical protein